MVRAEVTIASIVVDRDIGQRTVPKKGNLEWVVVVGASASTVVKSAIEKPSAPSPEASVEKAEVVVWTVITAVSLDIGPLNVRRKGSHEAGEVGVDLVSIVDRKVTL